MFDTLFDTIATILGLILDAGLLGPCLWMLLGFAVGCWFYRWMLKRDPAKLEMWAQEAKALAAKAKEKL